MRTLLLFTVLRVYDARETYTRGDPRSDTLIITLFVRKKISYYNIIIIIIISKRVKRQPRSGPRLIGSACGPTRPARKSCLVLIYSAPVHRARIIFETHPDFLTVKWIIVVVVVASSAGPHVRRTRYNVIIYDDNYYYCDPVRPSCAFVHRNRTDIIY